MSYPYRRKKRKTAYQTATLTRKDYEREYVKSVRKLNRLDNKYIKLSKLKTPNPVKLNIIKSRGNELLQEIQIIENELGIEEKNQIKNSKAYFCDNNKIN